MWGEALGLELSCFSGIKFPMCVYFETGSDFVALAILDLTM